jgi:hypothetical protein
MQAHGSALLMELPPLVLVGGAFLLGLGSLRREQDGGGHADPRRWLIIALLFVASLAHVPVIPDHLKEAPYMGVLFTLFTVGAFGLAALLAARPSPALYPLAGLFCAAAVVAYAATRLVAFPELADDVGNWTEPLGLVAVAAELGVVLLSTVAVRRTARAVRPERA